MSSLSKNIGGDDKEKSSSPMSQNKAVEIIQKYGSVMEDQLPAPGCVADVSKLPCTKERIKEALIIGLNSNVDQQMKEILKSGYLRLAEWQEGVGESDQGLDLSNVSLDDDPIKLAEGAENETWGPIILAEVNKLKHELKDLGLW